MAVLGNVATHFPCPNHCGESYRQEDIENHRKICRLEEIACEFSDVGCKQRFNREKKEEHVQENTQHHLSLAASQAIGTWRQLQHHQVQLKEVKENLEEDNQKQNSSLKKVEEKIMEGIRDLRNIVQQQQQTLIGQDVKLKSQDEKLKSQDEKLKSQEERLKKLKFERKVFAFFGFVTVLLLALLIYFAMDLKEEGTQKLGKLQNKYRELQNKYGELQNKYGELQNIYEELQNKYGELQNKYEELQNKYGELQNIYEELQNKYGELQNKYEELQNKYGELQNKYGELQNKYGELQNKYGELQNKYEELQNKYGELQNRYRNLSSIAEEIKTERRRTIQHLRALTNHVGQGHAVKIEKTFKMKDFSIKKSMSDYWISPAMYTHVCGYKFFLRIYPNGRDQHEDVEVALVVRPGQFDDFLSWPAKATFSLEVSNSHGGTKTFRYDKVKWNKPKGLEHIRFLATNDHGGSEVFCYHSKVQYFLLNDTLNFSVHVEF